MTTNIRIIQKSSSQKSMLISIPKETGWNAGDAVKFDKIDDNTIILKRLRE